MFVVLVAGCAMFQVSLVCFENVDGTMAIGYPNNVFFFRDVWKVKDLKFQSKIFWYDM